MDLGSNDYLKREQEISIQKVDTLRLVSYPLTLSQMTNFRLFQTEWLQMTIFEFDKNGREFSKWVENTVGKGEIVC